MATPQKLAADYEWLLNFDPYQKFIETNVTIIGYVFPDVDRRFSAPAAAISMSMLTLSYLCKTKAR